MQAHLYNHSSAFDPQVSKGAADILANLEEVLGTLNGGEKSKAFAALLTAAIDQRLKVDEANNFKRPKLPPSEMNPSEVLFEIMEFQNKALAQQASISSKTVDQMMKAKEKVHKERMEKLDQYRASMEKAKKAGIFGKIFGWMAEAITAILGVAIFLIPGMQPLALALIGTSVLMMLNQVSEQTGGWLVKGLSKPLKALGVKEGLAEIITSLTYTLTVTLLLGVGVWKCAGVGNLHRLAEMGQLASRERYVNQTIAKLFLYSEQVAAMLQIGEGGIQIIEGYMGYTGEVAYADAKFRRTVMAFLETGMQDLTDFLQQIYDNVNMLFDSTSDAMSTNYGAQRRIFQNV